MVKMGRLGTVIIFCVIAIHQAHGQTSGSNVPSSPLWPIFSQLLSTQTGRSIQDINILGLSDPTINQLWRSYTASLSKMTQTPAPTPSTQSTTPPPLPDLYQSSYSFSSSSSSNQGKTDVSAANTAKDGGSGSSGSSGSSGGSGSSGSSSFGSGARGTLSYNDILSLINQLSSAGSAAGGAPNAPTKTITSAQDVMNAYAQLSGSSGSSGSNPTQGNAVASGATSTGTDYQALLQKYMASTSGATPTGSTGTSASSSSSSSYQSLVDQYNSLMNQGGSAGSSNSGSTSYEQLLQQYNQIMGKTSGTSAAANSGSSPSSMMEQYLSLIAKPGSAPAKDQLLQMYKLMSGGKSPGTETTTTTPATTSASPQETFEKQLAIYFPQFKSLFPQSSTSNASTPASSNGSASASSGPAATNTAQMIFDTLLFAPNTPAAAVTSSGTSPGASAQVVKEASNSSVTAKPVDNSPLSYIQNMVNSRGGSEAILSNHVQNVFKTRASREMGCRFLPELLELEIMPTAPFNCMNRCPFPYVNSQQFGIYCVCCPPGVNEQTVGMMSLVRGTSYMETPLSVVS